MRYPRAMRRASTLLAVILSACAAERARGPLAIPLGLTRSDTGQALRAYDFCPRLGDARSSEELFPACDHPGLGRGDAWVVARYDGGVLVGLQRFERWTDPREASERWDQLVGKRAQSTPPSAGARAQLEARRELPGGTKAWVAFSSGEQLIGVYLISPGRAEDPSILEEIVPAVE